MRASLGFFFAFLFAGACAGAKGDAAVAGNVTVEIAPAKTSIHVGDVTLTISPMTRHGSTYSSTYAAKVIPYLFYNETGQFRIEISDADLVRLAGGQEIDLTGEAVRSDGVIRPVRGRAIPRSPADGQIKVRVFISRHLTLIFNTTYHLSGWQK